MIDFDASDHLAFEFGKFRLANAAIEAGGSAVSGHYVVIMKRYGRDWRIRAQLLLPTRGKPSPAWSDGQTASLQPMSVDQLSIPRCQVRPDRIAECRRAARPITLKPPTK